MAQQPDGAAAAGANASSQGEDVDWSSVEQVSMMVSRSTMTALQQLWRQHATNMDELGRAYAERMYDKHSTAVREIAEVKNFDLRRVLALLNSFTDGTRDLVLAVLQDLKQRDDDFTQQLYQTTRASFARNLRTALETRDAWYRDKLRGLRSRHEAQLAAVRHASAVELQQRQMQLKIALARTLAKSARGENPGAALASLGPAVGPSLPSFNATNTAGTAADAQSSQARSSQAAAIAAVTAAAAAVPGVGLGDGEGGTGVGSAASHMGHEAAMLEELFEDANAADALNRELEASLSRANAEILDLREKLEAVNVAAQEAATDAAQWRSKWAVESTKTDSIKRESMAIIAKCEEHLTQLQQQHIAEISQRDYLLQRCRDTIAALEARMPAGLPSLSEQD